MLHTTFSTSHSYGKFVQQVYSLYTVERKFAYN